MHESNNFPVRENRGSLQNTSRTDRLITTNNSYTPATNPQNAITNNNNTSRVVSERNARVFADRNIQSNNRNTDQRRYNRNVVASNNSYGNNNYRYNNNYRNNNSYQNNSYYDYDRNGGGRRFCVMYGPRYSYRPHNSISLYFGGFPYYYTSGLFYGYNSGYYQPVFPPFGIRISTLPFGYSSIYMGSDPYYYYNGIYYRQYENNNYEVVDAPMGATVSSLPNGAKSVVINGEKLYELNGTYYKEDRNSKGHTVYTVVGKNGEINNSAEENNDNYSASPLNNGDVVIQLPEGSKVVTLNGEKLYVTPDDTYLKEETNGDNVQYRVVGK